MIKVNKHSFSTNKLLTKKGFTLIELLVVIAIIGILATLIVASFSSAQQRSRDARRKSDLDAVKKALELAKADSTGGAFYPAAVSVASLVTPGYIRVIPADPSTGAAYAYTGGGCGASGCPTYTLVACLENANDPQRDAADTCGGAGAPVSYTILNP